MKAVLNFITLNRIFFLNKKLNHSCSMQKNRWGRQWITEFQTAANQCLTHGEQNTYVDVYPMKK